MSDVLEQILSWSAFVRYGPADQVWSSAEEKDGPPIHVGDRAAMAALMERVAKRVAEECAERVRLGIIDENGNLPKKPAEDDPSSPSGSFGGWG